MTRRMLALGRSVADVDSPLHNGPLGLVVRVAVCIAGGTLGWLLAQL